MKKLIKILSLLFTICTLSTNMVFAQSTVTPIDGTEVGLEHDPSDIAMPPLTTDANGKFACKLEEGKYKLNISYSRIERILSSQKLSMSNVEISLLLYSQSTNAKENSIAKTSVDKESGALSINIPKGGSLLSGIISYELKDYNRSYPNADGNLLNSKPLFYNSDGNNTSNDLKNVIIANSPVTEAVFTIIKTLHFTNPDIHILLNRERDGGASFEIDGVVTPIASDDFESFLLSKRKDANSALGEQSTNMYNGDVSITTDADVDFKKDKGRVSDDFESFLKNKYADDFQALKDQIAALSTKIDGIKIPVSDDFESSLKNKYADDFQALKDQIAALSTRVLSDKCLASDNFESSLKNKYADDFQALKDQIAALSTGIPADKILASDDFKSSLKNEYLVNSKKQDLPTGRIGKTYSINANSSLGEGTQDKYPSYTDDFQALKDQIAALSTKIDGIKIPVPEDFESSLKNKYADGFQALKDQITALSTRVLSDKCLASDNFESSLKNKYADDFQALKDQIAALSTKIDGYKIPVPDDFESSLKNKYADDFQALKDQIAALSTKIDGIKIPASDDFELFLLSKRKDANSALGEQSTNMYNGDVTITIDADKEMFFKKDKGRVSDKRLQEISKELGIPITVKK